MKPSTSFLLIFGILLQLMGPVISHCSLDSLVDEKIKDALNRLELYPSEVKHQLSCTTVKASGKLASCYSGMALTGCACGYGCGSWHVENGNSCVCECSGMDWTAARCCQMT